jgi:hypothetical protein
MINPLSKGAEMHTSSFARERAQTGAKRRMGWRRPIEQAQVACSAAGLFGGVASAIFGSVLIGVSWLVADEGAHRWLSTIGSILLILTIPLLIIGDFCMDWLEKGNPQGAPKVARYEYDDEE